MERELDLVNKVDLRFALAELDEALETALNLYLPATLLKLASPHAPVRLAVFKCVQHVFPRVTAARSLKLPHGALLEQALRPAVDLTQVRLYSLLFLAKAVDRLTPHEKQQLTPQVVRGIAGAPLMVQARLFSILVRLLEVWQSADEKWHAEDETWLAQKFTQFFLLAPVEKPVVLPGLTAENVAFFTKDAGVSYTLQQLAAAKQHILLFLDTFADPVQPLFVALCDPSSVVADRALTAFKKCNVENTHFVEFIIGLLCGEPPVNEQLQERIMQLLAKSDYAAKHAKIGQIVEVGYNAQWLRLRNTTVLFIRKAAREDVNKEFGADLLAKIRLSLSEGDSNGRRLQYEAYGEILRNRPETWFSDLSHIRFLFKALAEEAFDLRPVVQDVLSSLTVHLPKLGQKSELKLILRKSFREPLCRYTAVKYINCAFSFSDAEARYLCVLATFRENSLDTIEEARKGLHPHLITLLQASNSEYKSSGELLGKVDIEYPSFSDLVVTFTQSKDPEFEACAEEAIRFVLRMLAMQAIGSTPSVVVADSDWEARVDKALEVDQTVRSSVCTEIGRLSDAMDDELETLFVTFLTYVLKAVETAKVAGTLHFLLSMSPQSVVGQFTRYIPKLTQKDVYPSLAIICTHPNVGDPEIEGLLRLAKSVLAPGYIISRLLLRGRALSIPRDFLGEYFETLKDKITDSRHYDDVLEALSQMAVYGVFSAELGFELDVDYFYDKILPRAKACHELSVFALAKLALREASDSPELTPTEQVVYDTHNSKQVDFLFASGEALLLLAGGWALRNLQREADILGESPKYLPEMRRAGTVLQHVLSACKHTKPALRRSSCLWLLSLVQFLDAPEIRQRAAEIHVAFMRFLADRDELVQDAALRGLSTVYEMGDADLKETLVKGLFKSFTDSAASTALGAGSVGLETQLFDADVLKTDDGSVSTYKDVLNLASDVGDPGLVYKFMLLARLNALWLLRRGMAFGLGSIMASASLNDMLEQDPSLAARLVPKLFRYRFDPSSGVARLMEDIWAALVRDSGATTRRHFDAILNELLRGLGHREWRVRQASATALHDLVLTQPLALYAARTEEIWNMGFRAMDDIKDSVRKSGTQLCKLLARTLTSTADVGAGATAAQALLVLARLMPFFLGPKGLLSDAADVRSFALETVLKLCRVGGPAVRPHVPRLVAVFVELMLALEPDVVNYLVLNADKYNLSGTEVDAQRILSVGASPMMDALEQMVALVDADLAAPVVELLRAAVKKLVGLPSKIAGCRAIVSLVTNKYSLVRPYGELLLATCSAQLLDRSGAVAASYAAAAGYACKMAPPAALVRYSDKIAKMYFDGESEERQRAAVAAESVSRFAGHDQFSAVALAYLPVAFIGKHDPEESVRRPFEQEWTETSGSLAMRLYFDEILALCESQLQLSNYRNRQTVAAALALVGLETYPERQAKRLLDLLWLACQGKSWEGKEVVFAAFVDFVIKNKEHIDDALKVEKTLLTEGNRRNKTYQMKAIKSVGNYVHAFDCGAVTESYCGVMRDIFSSDYLSSVDLDLPKAPAQKAAAIEELYLGYLSNIFQSPKPQTMELGFECMDKMAALDLTWRSADVFNDCFRTLLEAGVDLLDKMHILLNFSEANKLERVAVKLVRNCGLLLRISHSNDIVTALNNLRTNASTVLQNEIDSALV